MSIEINLLPYLVYFKMLFYRFFFVNSLNSHVHVSQHQVMTIVCRNNNNCFKKKQTLIELYKRFFFHANTNFKDFQDC